MLGIIGALLVIWLVLILIGALAKGLVWLAIVGGVLFLVTGGYGWIKRKALR